MDLLHKQFIFSNLIAGLILYAHEKGYGVTLGEAWRPPEMAKLYAEEGKGILNSNHCKRLAIDLNLFNGDALSTDTVDYAALADVWEKLSDVSEGITCVWGGRFHKPDIFHFSIAHDGVE